jgi:dynein heavy chain, axonemal
LVDGAQKESKIEGNVGKIQKIWEDQKFEFKEYFFTEIELCEKALNEYLEQKKKMFPRFYFVSNQALLDILSNGNNPPKVDEYIGDCFDGMKGLQFLTGEGQPTPAKNANGMHSKAKEFVAFTSTFTCNGAVENYLCDIERQMQITLRDLLEVAKQTADNWELDKKRHDWLDDYCEQIALLGTQLMWTEGVARAFEELEGGSESAMKDYLNFILVGIKNLIERVREDLTPLIRGRIITILSSETPRMSTRFASPEFATGPHSTTTSTSVMSVVL